MTKHEIKQNSFRNKQHRLAKKCKNGKCLILKGGYYYRDDYKGYTEHTQYAGVYDVNDALMHVTGCSWTDFISMVPIDSAKHNKLIYDHVKLLLGHIV